MHKDEPFTAMGIAAWAVMRGLVIGLVKAGQEKEAMAILDNAVAYLSHENMGHVAKMRQALERVEKLKQQLVLLGHRPDGQAQ